MKFSLMLQKEQVTVPDLRPVHIKAQQYLYTEMSALLKMDLQGLTYKPTILQQYINI